MAALFDEKGKRRFILFGQLLKSDSEADVLKIVEHFALQSDRAVVR